jgi:hypothetical protein
MNAAPAHSPAIRSERRIALVKPAIDAEDSAALAMKLLDSMLWVFKGTTQSNWNVSTAERAQVVVVYHDEPAQRIARWRNEGKLIVVIGTDAAASPISPYSLIYPFPTIQVLSLLERLDAELDSGARVAGGAGSSFPVGTVDTVDSDEGDPWSFVEALRTLRLVNNADLWLVGKGSAGPLLWLQGDGSRYCCDPATARAIRMGTRNLSGLTLQKAAPPAGLDPRPGSELAWFEGYHASARIAPWLSERATYRLTRWPDLGRVHPDDPALRAAQIRLLAALDAEPATLAELATRTRTSPEVAVRTLNALAGCELVEIAPTAAPGAARTQPVSAALAGRLRQFLRNMRRHLGLGTSP